MMKHFVVITLSMMALFVSTVSEARDRPLVVGWTEIVPLFRAEIDGSPGGFGVEVIRRIADRAGFQVEFRKFDRAENLIRAQATGEIDLLPAIAALPLLRERNLFSDPIAETSIRVFVRAEETELLDPATMTGKRIAIPSVPLGPDGDALLARNIPVQTMVGTTSITELLRGTVDALIASDSVTIADAHALRLDHRIVAVGVPIRTFKRVVTIRREKSELLGPINHAIAALEAEGTLADLRNANQVAVAPPEPAILTVGVFHSPPYNIVAPDGGFSGFSVETLQNLATAAGLNIQFVNITREDWNRGPGPGRYDILTPAGISSERLDRMDFTIPVDRSSIEIFSYADNGDGNSRSDSLAGLRVGVEAGGFAQREAKKRRDLDLHIFDDPTALLTALLDRDVDVILSPRQAVLAESMRIDATEQIREYAAPFYKIDRGIALRFGLGQVRERLNAVIPGYLASTLNAELRDKYFGISVFWTDSRVNWLIIMAIGAALLLTAAFTSLLVWRHQRSIRDRRQFASELVDHIPLGMLLVSSAGRIEFANSEIKERTPDGHNILVEGASYREAIKSLIDREIINSGDRTKDEMLKQMTEVALQNGYSEEYRLSNGGIFVRSAKAMSNGATLLTRLDITEYRRRLTEIRDLNNRLSQQVAMSNAANNELRAFAYATSHDLKAPSNTMSLLTDALGRSLAGTLSDDEAELFGDLRATNKRMSQIIEDVLDYTNAIGTDVQRTEVDLNVIVTEVLENLRADIAVSGARIKQQPLPPINANPAQMRQLLQNLLSNAIKFRLPDRTPLITIAPSDTRAGLIAFSVSDNGIGIAAEHQEKIFQLFSRLHNYADYSGTGLGLAICQRIALNHGGGIEVTSEPGSGATFIVRLKDKQNDQQFNADRR